jgi:hypothetical protein
MRRTGFSLSRLGVTPARGRSGNGAPSSTLLSTGQRFTSDAYKAGVYAGHILLVDTVRDHD